MELQRVLSSNLEAIGYDNMHQELYVLFKDGKLLAYQGVTSVEHNNLMRSPSKGSYFNKVIANKPYKVLPRG